MTTDDAKRVIYSHKFVENQHIYGFARRNANRALTEVDTYIKNHQFMNNYIEKRYGNNCRQNSGGGGVGGGANTNTPTGNGSSRPTYSNSNYQPQNHQQQQYQQRYNGGAQYGNYGGGYNNYNMVQQNERKYGQVSMTSQQYQKR